MRWEDAARDAAQALRLAADTVNNGRTLPFTAVAEAAASIVGSADPTALGRTLPELMAVDRWKAVTEAIEMARLAGGFPPIDRLRPDFRAVHVLRAMAAWCDSVMTS